MQHLHTAITNFFLFSFLVTPIHGLKKQMIVTVPVADLRLKPDNNYKLAHKTMDWGETSQLLFGEPIIVYESRNGWLRVTATEQTFYAHNKWHRLDGWIRAEQATLAPEKLKSNLIVSVPTASITTRGKIIQHLSLGTKLHGIKKKGRRWILKLPDGSPGFIAANFVAPYNPNQQRPERWLRKTIVSTAKLFVGGPYLWGGRSFYNPKLKPQTTGVDCSSLVELCYKVSGIDVSRNSRSQYQQCKKLQSNPKLGDLIFWATHPTTKSIKHVRIYCGNDQFIEAFGGKLRKIVLRRGRDVMGKPVEQLQSGDPIHGGYVYFGTLL